MALLLGIDFGTSYFKVGLFDAQGAQKGLGRVAVHKASPHPGWSQLPVADFWRILGEGLTAALAEAQATASDIVGVSYSSQANTLLLLDRHDQPLTPLVVWTDVRPQPLEPAIEAFGLSPAFQQATGFKGLAPGFSSVKYRWFQQHEPALWAQVARVMTLSDYFTFMLTGATVGDASTAAFTGLYSNLQNGWWPEALKFFGVPRAFLSQPLRPGTVVGRTTPRAQEFLGLPAGVPFAVGAIDHHMAAIGSGIARLAEASISTGTVLAALILVDAVKPVMNCYHGPHVDQRFYRLAFDPAGATQLEDYQRQFAPHLDIAQLVALAGTVPPEGAAAAKTSDHPDWKHAVVIRTMMERISATQRDLLHQVQAASTIRRVIATGGGARSTSWLQINADLLNVTMIAPRCHERACLGAAAFAAVAAEIYRTIPEALDAMVQGDRVITPVAATVAIYAKKYPRAERTEPIS